MIYRFQEACLAGKWGTSVLQVLQACSVFTNLSLEHNRLEINLQYVYHALLSFGMAHPLSTLIHYAMFAVTISSPDHAYCVGHKWAGTRLPCSQEIGFYRESCGIDFDDSISEGCVAHCISYPNFLIGSDACCQMSPQVTAASQFFANSAALLCPSCLYQQQLRSLFLGHTCVHYES